MSLYFLNYTFFVKMWQVFIMIKEIELSEGQTPTVLLLHEMTFLFPASSDSYVKLLNWELSPSKSCKETTICKWRVCSCPRLNSSFFIDSNSFKIKYFFLKITGYPIPVIRAWLCFMVQRNSKVTYLLSSLHACLRKFLQFQHYLFPHKVNEANNGLITCFKMDCRNIPHIGIVLRFR